MLSYYYRWNFVIHGGIDGHTRLIVYLKCSGNNQADTVYNCFEEAVQLHGLYQVVSERIVGGKM